MSLFSRGARVQLRTGSPDLCVTGVFGELSGCPMVAVAWYTQAGELHRADLPAEALELSPPTTQATVDRAQLVGTWKGPDPRGGDFKELELQLAEGGTGTMRMTVHGDQFRGTLSRDVKYAIEPGSARVKLEYGKDVGAVELAPDGQLRVTLGKETGLLKRQ